MENEHTPCNSLTTPNLQKENKMSEMEILDKMSEMKIINEVDWDTSEVRNIDREYIVKCVDNHEALVDALKAARKFILHEGMNKNDALYQVNKALKQAGEGDEK